MNFSLSRRRLRRLGEIWEECWDSIFLALVLGVLFLALIYVAQAVFSTPVAVENKQKIEEQYNRDRREAIQEHEDGKQESGVVVGVQDAAAPRPARDP